MKQCVLAAIAGAAMATASYADPAHEQMYETGDMIPQTDMDAFWKNRAERRSPDRSLVSSSRGPVYALRDTFDTGYARITDFSPFTGSILAGQLNPDGQAWQSVSWGGIVDNATALSNSDGDLLNGEYNGPPGGPDPAGVRDGMAHVQRASVGDAIVDGGAGIETYEYFTNFYTSTTDQPLFLEIDIYKAGHETFQWFRPLDYVTGCFVSGILMGGYNDSGLFLPLAQMHGDPNLVEGAVILANVAGDPSAGEFVLNPKIIPEDGWFTLGILLAPEYMQILVRDAETLADNDMDGSPDWKMPMNTLTGMRMFEELGYGLEEGWASILPGTLDDPMTSDIEGAGYAVNEDGVVTDRYFHNGNDVATLFAKSSFSAMRFYHGSDPTTAQLPGYMIEDWWMDDLRIRGVEIPIGGGEPPAYTIPYVEDFEGWAPGRLGLQGGRWAESREGPVAEFVDGANHTPPPGNTDDGMPSQSLRLTYSSLLSGGLYNVTTNLPTTPQVRGELGDPAVLSAAFRVQSSLTPLGMQGIESFPTPWANGAASSVLAEQVRLAMGYVWTSCLDENGLGDGAVYVRQRKPVGTDVAGGEYDPLAPMAVLEGPYLAPDQEADVNSPFVNVVAAPAGQASFSVPNNVWNVFRMEAEPSAGARGADDAHTLRVYVSVNDGAFVELFPNGDVSQSFTTNMLAPTDLRFSTPSTFAGGFVSTFIDDIFFDGPTETDTVVPIVPELAGDAAWSLPFADSLDTYEKGRPATPQGYANRRQEFLPTERDDHFPEPEDWEEIELIDGATPLQNGDPVRIYEIYSIEAGSPGFALGDIVAVSDDIARTIDPDDEIFGVEGLTTDDEPTEWYILDAVDGTEVARGRWFLANETGAYTFDDGLMIDMGARFSYRLESRYTGPRSESEFVSAAGEGVDTARGSRGDVLKLVNSTSLRGETPSSIFATTTTEMFRGFFPTVAPENSTDALLSFDLYVGQPTFTTGFYAVFDNGGADGGQITALGFGGLGFQSGNSVGGVAPYLPTGNFSVLVPNPNPAAGQPREIWQDTGVPVPTEEWVTVEFAINSAAEYAISIDTALIASGTAIDADDEQLNVLSLDSVVFRRNHIGSSDGLPTPGDISWSALAFDAVTTTDDYHYYRIDNEVLVEAGQSVPQIWPVDAVSGAPDTTLMGMPATRELRDGDIVALRNEDPSTGQSFEFPPLGQRYEIVSGARGALIATGGWSHLGLPGETDPDDLAPRGGIDPGATPPYNNTAPYDTILLGEYENVDPTTIVPADTWYVDNFSVRTTACVLCCPANLDGSGNQVNSGDLAVLLAAWGSSNLSADLDGSGVVDSGDLAILLAAWGLCP